MKHAENLANGFNEPGLISDEESWKKVKAGDQSALSFLYKKYIKHLYRYGFFLINDKDLVEDAIHDVFLNLWNSRKNQIDIHNLRAYLYTSVRREVFLKKKKYNRTSFKIEEIEDRLLDQPSVEDLWIRSEDEQENIQRVRSFINNLSDRQREIIFLRYYQNLSYQEISDLLKIDQNYAYNLTSKAFNQLRKQFENSLK